MTDEDRLISIEERLNALYEKEVSRVLTESKLIEEIIRLEKIEAEFNRLLGFIKKEKIDLSRIHQDLDQIVSKRIESAVAGISTERILKAIIRSIECLRDDDY